MILTHAIHSRHAYHFSSCDTSDINYIYFVLQFWCITEAEILKLQVKNIFNFCYLNTATVEVAYSVLFLLYFYISGQLIHCVTAGSFCCQPAC